MKVTQVKLYEDKTATVILDNVLKLNDIRVKDRGNWLGVFTPEWNTELGKINVFSLSQGLRDNLENLIKDMVTQNINLQEFDSNDELLKIKSVKLSNSRKRDVLRVITFRLEDGTILRGICLRQDKNDSYYLTYPRNVNDGVIHHPVNKKWANYIEKIVVSQYLKTIEGESNE